MKTTKEQRIKLFKQWIPTQVGERKMLHAHTTAQQYLKALDMLSQLPIAEANLGADHDILGDSAAERFSEEVELAFLTDPDFKALNDGATRRGEYSAALAKYRCFLDWMNGAPDGNEFWACWTAGLVARRDACFRKWMRTQYSELTHRKFDRDTVDSYASRLRSGGYRGFNFFAVESSSDLAGMQRVLAATSDYKAYSRKDHNALSSALKVYARYLEALEA